MGNEILFDKIIDTTSKDEAFRKDVLNAYESNSLSDFCRICREKGIEIYPMDIIDADESAYAAMRRSTNGGGENSPHLSWEENIFEGIIEAIKKEPFPQRPT